MRGTLVLFAILLTHPASSQIKDLHLKRLSVKDGLLKNNAIVVLQDKSGCILFGTQKGSVRYDGYKVHVYNLDTWDKHVFYLINEKKRQLYSMSQPTVTVVSKRAVDRVEISVKNNGNSILEKVVDKIIQPFFATKPTGQGTGLGLSLM